VILGIICKYGNPILGACSIQNVFLSSNATKTVRCESYDARSYDDILLKCDRCSNEYTENLRVFKRKGFICVCYKCLLVQTSLKKYGVDSPNKSAIIKNKQHNNKKTYQSGDAPKPRISCNKELSELRSRITKERWRTGKYQNTAVKLSLLAKERWQDPSFRSKALIYLQSDKNRNIASENSKRRWRNDREKVLQYLRKGLSSRLSKLHKKIREALNLSQLGFVSEQVVDGFIVDELNIEKKIIIEINGDYVHANPKLYKETDIIKLANSKYTAKEKWLYDEFRIKTLESLGYKVIIIWESDNLDEALSRIRRIIS